MNSDTHHFSVKRLSTEEADRVRMIWMSSIKKERQRSYSVTSDEQRFKMLWQVITENKTISEAAREYGIKYTTAKHILSVFIKEGRIKKKKSRIRKKRKSSKDMKA